MNWTGLNPNGKRFRFFLCQFKLFALTANPDKEFPSFGVSAISNPSLGKQVGFHLASYYSKLFLFLNNIDKHHPEKIICEFQFLFFLLLNTGRVRQMLSMKLFHFHDRF